MRLTPEQKADIIRRAEQRRHRFFPGADPPITRPEISEENGLLFVTLFGTAPRDMGGYEFVIEKYLILGKTLRLYDYLDPV